MWFYGEEVTVSYYEPLPAAEIAPLVDELGSHGFVVRTLRNLEPSMAQTLIEVAALALTFASGLAAKGFLEELGKDAWRGVRAVLYRLYRTAKERGRRYIYAISLSTTVDGVPVIFRVESDNLPQEALLTALDAARAAIALDMAGQESVRWYDGSKRFVLDWDEGLGCWRPKRIT